MNGQFVSRLGRIDSFDICKGICILMVILGHQYEKLGLKTELQYIQTFHMPLFFMIAGYFVSDSSSFKAFAIKRAQRLMIPYIVSCVIAIPLCIWLSDGFDIKDWIWRILNACGHGESDRWPLYIGKPVQIGMLWYLPGLMWSSITVKAISKTKMAGVIALMVSAVAIATSSIYGWIPFSIQNGLGAVMWVWLGYHVKEKELLPEIEKILRSPWIILIIVVWFFSARHGFIRLYMNSYDFGIVDVVGAVAGSLLVFGFSEVIDRRTRIIKMTLSRIGINSLLIYSLHFLEHNVRPVSIELMKIGLTDKMQIALLSWVSISAICVLLSIELDKIPLVKKIYG